MNKLQAIGVESAMINQPSNKFNIAKTQSRFSLKKKGQLCIFPCIMYIQN